jgi:uncharacterized damage-inducible protein DinB
MTESDRIADELTRAHRGDPWHGSSARALLTGLTAERAARRPIPTAHTIWELLLHLTGWRREVTRRLDGGNPTLPAGGDWPAMPAGSDDAWKRTLAEFDAASEELLAALARFDARRMDDLIGEGRSAPVGTGVSWYVMLHGVAQHDAYHMGQVSLLRKLVNDVSR